MVSVSAFIVASVVDEEGKEVRSAVDWARVRAMHADGVPKPAGRIPRMLEVARDDVAHGRLVVDHHHRATRMPSVHPAVLPGRAPPTGGAAGVRLSSREAAYRRLAQRGLRFVSHHHQSFVFCNT